MDYKHMEKGRERALEAVRERIMELRITSAELARRADLDAGTVGDFVAGRKWSRLETRGAIEQALGWSYGEIDRIASGATDDSQTDDAEYGVLLDFDFDALEGLTPAQRAETIAGTKATLLRLAREVRRDADAKGE